jgi:hypothetical protein
VKGYAREGACKGPALGVLDLLQGDRQGILRAVQRRAIGLPLGDGARVPRRLVVEPAAGVRELAASSRQVDLHRRDALADLLELALRFVARALRIGESFLEVGDPRRARRIADLLRLAQ